MNILCNRCNKEFPQEVMKTFDNKNYYCEECYPTMKKWWDELKTPEEGKAPC